MPGDRSPQGAADRERSRRLALWGQADPMQLGQLAYYRTPAWDAFFGSLKDNEEDAAANGLGYRVNLAGIGQGPDAGGGGRLTSTDKQGIAGNIALSQYVDAHKAGLLNQRIGTAAAQQAEGAASDALVGDLQRSYDENSVASAGLGLDLGTPQGKQTFLSRLPPNLRPSYEAAFQKQDLAERAQAVNEAAQTEKTRAAMANEAILGGSTLSEDAIDQNARQYLQTGVMPTLGMKDPGNRAKILNRAAQLGGDQSLAVNKADYKADAGSLTAMQKQRDAIGAFENTAGKNIDLFLQTAGKVVDTGSPMANTLARAVSGKMLGSPDQAAFDAARQVAINEIAKVTTNPTLSGQLSDTARREVDAFNPQNATLAQAVAVARLLKQDMGNRMSSLDEQLKTIKGRIAAPSGATAPKGADPLGIR